MLLVVDVGNTQTHFGLFRNSETTVAEHWRFATVRDSTGDELGAALQNLLGLRGLGFGDVDASIVSRMNGTSTPASPPVAITKMVGPSSSRSRRTIPST